MSYVQGQCNLLAMGTSYHKINIFMGCKIYMPNFRTCENISDGIILARPNRSYLTCCHGRHSNADACRIHINLLPDGRLFARGCKYIPDASLMPDLNWSSLDKRHAEKSTRNLNARMQVYNLWPQKTSNQKTLSSNQSSCISFPTHSS